MRARFRPLAVLGLFALACSGASQVPEPTGAPAPPPAIAAPAPVPTRPTWLYEIRSETQPSYVFAALDPGCPLHESFPDDYMVLFRYARQVIVTDAQTADQAHESLVTSGLDRSGSLERTLGAEQFALLASALDDLVPADVLRFLRPLWAVMLVPLALSAEAYGVTASDGRLSPTHDAVARRQMSQAPVLGLFDHDDIDRTFSALGPLATDGLRATLDHLDDERTSARSLLAAYRAGDETALLALSDQHTPGTERLFAAASAEVQRAIDEHVALTETELRAGNALVLLPQEQVLGERGLLALLRADGFEVSRISAAAPE